MKKSVALLTGILFFGYITTKAQCYGVVNFDTATSAGVVGNAGNSTFTIPTANPNELIMIAYDGWNGPGSGPVTVDGNPATFLANSINGNSGSAMTYAYVAPTAGVHTIVASTGGYNTGYYINMAAAFYVTGTCAHLNVDSLFSTTNSIACTTGGSISGSITTTRPGSMIFTNCEINEGQSTTFPISWTGATFLGNEHTEDGIDAGDGYTIATTAGSYSPTATNSSPSANGCGGLTLVLTAIQPPFCSSLTLTTTQVNPTCGNSNGSATVTATGGITPYTYSWSPSGGSNLNATGLSAATYTVTVSDKNGCSATASVVLVSTASVIPSITSFMNIKCNGGNTDSAEASATGGVLPYTYAWSNGQTTTNITGLTAGTYSIAITDKNGCVGTATVNITQPAVLTAPVTNITNEKCNGGSNGSLTVTASGGTTPYTYSWNNGQTSSKNSGLTIGTYTLTVTDSNGCTATASASISQPTAITATVTHTTTTCGGNNGSATATATGGTGAFTYSWAPSGGTSATASGLSGGTYTCTVTDSNGCTQIVTAIINSSGGTTVTPTVVNPLCNSGLGSATANVTGGLAPYTYSWAPSGGTNATASNLTAGTYTCTVTDANGCITIQTFTITVPVVLAESITGTTPANCGEPVGSSTASASGGTGTYTYSWAPSGGTNATAVGLSAGSYTCTVTDANGCIQTQTVNVPGTPGLVVSVSPNVTIYNGDSTTLAATGGGTYSWGPLTGLSCDSCPDPTATPTVTTTYTVTIDSAGCTATRVVVVTVEVNCADFVVPNVFTPNNDGINDDFVIRILNPSSYSIIIYDRLGKEVYTSTDPTKFWNGSILTTQYLVPDGVYYYLISASCGTNNYQKKGFVQVLGGK